MNFYEKILPEERRGQLKKILQEHKSVQLIEAHNGLSGIIGNNAGLSSKSFDGLWISSLTTTASIGIPDCEIEPICQRIEKIDEILSVTNKPVMVDGDTGGDVVNFEYLCAKLEAMGVSAIVIEDKRLPKRNSLSNEANQYLEDPTRFAEKLYRGRCALKTKDFLVFARLESLIANQSVQDAIERARVYLMAGADGIFIHSKKQDPTEIIEFLKAYKQLAEKLNFRKPVICTPTKYNAITATELFSLGANIVIHANHLLRASVLAMQQVCQIILKNDRSLEADAQCASINDIFSLTGFNDISIREKQLNK